MHTERHACNNLTWERNVAVQIGGLSQAVTKPQRQIQSERWKSHAAPECCLTLFVTQSNPSTFTVLSLCSPPLLLYLLYAPSRGYADQCPLNLSSASVCAKIIGDSPPAASGANIRSLLLQGGVSFVVSTAPAGRLVRNDPVVSCKRFKWESACMWAVQPVCIPMSVVQTWLVWLPRLSACMSKEALWRIRQHLKKKQKNITAAWLFFQPGLMAQTMLLR